MDLEATVKAIRFLYVTVSGKPEAEVHLIYKGPGYGLTKLWQARIDVREYNHETYDGALNGLLDHLKKDLDAKVRFADAEVQRLRQAFNTLGN